MAYTTKKIIGVVLILTCIPAMLGFVNQKVKKLDPPKYGSWTGIRPLETKIDMLQEFSKEKAVDAVILGSSIVDFGFSAEKFSELMTDRNGKPYRAFNFSTGGAELRTLPMLYRYMRTVAKPKEIIVIAPAQQKLGEEIAAMSPDRTLMTSPSGRAHGSQIHLNISKKIWDIPLLKYAPALRDRMVYGDYHHLQSKIGSEAYALNNHGDRLSYLVTWLQSDLPLHFKQNETAITQVSVDSNSSRALSPSRHFFSDRDIDALSELRSLAKADGIKVSVLSTAAAASFFGGPITNQNYKAARKEFFSTLAEQLGAQWYGPDDLISVPVHGISDTTHLNRYGAQLVTQSLFNALAGIDQKSAEETWCGIPGGLLPTTDKTFNLWGAVLLRKANEASAQLTVDLVKSDAVPALPAVSTLRFALRDCSNRDHFADLKLNKDGSFTGIFNLPRSTINEVMLLRVITGQAPNQVAISSPIAAYRWN